MPLDAELLKYETWLELTTYNTLIERVGGINRMTSREIAQNQQLLPQAAITQALREEQLIRYTQNYISGTAEEHRNHIDEAVSMLAGLEFKTAGMTVLDEQTLLARRNYALAKTTYYRSLLHAPAASTIAQALRAVFPNCAAYALLMPHVDTYEKEMRQAEVLLLADVEGAAFLDIFYDCKAQIRRENAKKTLA